MSGIGRKNGQITTSHYMQFYVLIKSISVIQDDVRVILWKTVFSRTSCHRRWDLNPGPLGQQASAKPTYLPWPLTSLREDWSDVQAVLITSFSHMHLSGDAKDLLHKCIIRLIWVFAIRTCNKCHFSWYIYSPTSVQHVWPKGLCDQIHFADFSWSKNCPCRWGRLS